MVSSGTFYNMFCGMLAFFMQFTDVQYTDPKDEKKVLIYPISNKNHLHKWRQDIGKSFFRHLFETTGIWGEGLLEDFWMKAHSMNFLIERSLKSALSSKCALWKWIFSICYNQGQWSHRLKMTLRCSKEISLHKLIKYAYANLYIP